MKQFDCLILLVQNDVQNGALHLRQKPRVPWCHLAARLMQVLASKPGGVAALVTRDSSLQQQRMFVDVTRATRDAKVWEITGRGKLVSNLPVRGWQLPVDQCVNNPMGGTCIHRASLVQADAFRDRVIGLSIDMSLQWKFQFLATAIDFWEIQLLAAPLEPWLPWSQP